MTVAEQAQAVGDYWATHPDPKDASTWAPYQNYSDAKQAYRAVNGGPPEPPAVPGPSIPGAGMAVARAGDITNHGATIGPVTTGVAARVMIGGKPVACAGDPHLCPMFSGAKPHAGGSIAKGSATVFIGNMPVARVADPTVCTAEPGNIAVGEVTVLVGG
jgi:uncharacterized Zn-binding protein involved in type VI secretion